MALVPVNLSEKKGHSGKGAGLGALIGGAVGAIGGAFAGGPAGAVGGASAGASLGGLVGNQIDPSKPAEASGDNVPLSGAGAPEKTVPLQRFENHPEVQLANLQTAREALKVEPSISAQDAKLMDNDFLASQEILKKRLTT